MRGPISTRVEKGLRAGYSPTNSLTKHQFKPLPHTDAAALCERGRPVETGATIRHIIDAPVGSGTSGL
jgi:hypothetical protein